jgi:hypothetical protein
MTHRATGWRMPLLMLSTIPIPTVWKLRWIFLISTPFEMLKSIYLQIPSFLGTPKSTLSLPSPPCRLGQHLKSYPSLPHVPRCGSTVSPLALTQSIFLSIHDSTVVGLWDIVRYDIYIYVCAHLHLASHRCKDMKYVARQLQIHNNCWCKGKSRGHGARHGSVLWVNTWLFHSSSLN